MVSRRLEGVRNSALVLIDEAATELADLQERMVLGRLTVPQLELIGAHTVRATWSDTDSEVFWLSPYGLLLCRLVINQLRIPVLGFDTGEWPGGLRFDEVPGWKRVIWTAFRKGSFARESSADDNRVVAQ